MCGMPIVGLIAVNHGFMITMKSEYLSSKWWGNLSCLIPEAKRSCPSRLRRSGQAGRAFRSYVRQHSWRICRICRCRDAGNTRWLGDIPDWVWAPLLIIKTNFNYLFQFMTTEVDFFTIFWQIKGLKGFYWQLKGLKPRGGFFTQIFSWPQFWSIKFNFQTINFGQSNFFDPNFGQNSFLTPKKFLSQFFLPQYFLTIKGIFSQLKASSKFYNSLLANWIRFGAPFEVKMRKIVVFVSPLWSHTSNPHIQKVFGLESAVKVALKSLHYDNTTVAYVNHKAGAEVGWCIT